MKISGSLARAVFVGALSGCAAHTTPPATGSGRPAAAVVPLIPRAVLFGNPQRLSPRISPDGTMLAFLAPVDGVLNLWVGPAADVASARPMTRMSGQGVSTFTWMPGKQLLYLFDERGDENHHLFALDLTSGQSRDLTPLEGVQAQIIRTSQRHPRQVLVGLNDRDRRLHDLYIIDVQTAQRRLVEKNEGFVAFFADSDFAARIAVAPSKEGGLHVYRRVDRSWKPFLSFAMEEATGQLHGLDASGRYLYATDVRGRDRGVLTRIDLETGRGELLAEDGQADIEQVLFSPHDGRPQAAAARYLRRRWQAIDPTIEADLQALRTLAEGDFDVLSRTADDSSWVVEYDDDRHPVRYYLYDRRTKHGRLLFSTRPDLAPYPLSRTHALVVKARDGLDLVTYVTLPPAEGDSLKPKQPLPTVLVVHGGPWERDRWGFDARDQWLANRGYAVLHVNFRGSIGFGRGFINRANGEWAGKMHDDLVDAVQWAIRTGIADRHRIAIMGGSYGGYAALVGLSFTPELFACGVARVAWSNLVTYFGGASARASSFMDIVAARVGDPRTEEGRRRLLERSPLTRAKQIRRPLLIAQGANDSRVKPAEADQLLAAMGPAASQVIYLLYENEGHFFRRPESRMSFNALSERFLKGCLGGRSEPVGDTLKKAKLEVRHGQKLVDSLGTR